MPELLRRARARRNDHEKEVPAAADHLRQEAARTAHQASGSAQQCIRLSMPSAFDTRIPYCAQDGFGGSFDRVCRPALTSDIRTARVPFASLGPNLPEERGQIPWLTV